MKKKKALKLEEKTEIIMEVVCGEEMGSGSFDLFGYEKMTSLARRRIVGGEVGLF